jgi:hypothetical protein
MGYSRRQLRRVLSTSVGVAALAAGTLLGGTAAGAIPIPSVPGCCVPAYVGAASTAAPISSYPVPQNPFMAPNDANSIHNDAYASDTYVGAGPRGRAPAVNSAFYGVSECATLTFDANGNIVGLCVETVGPKLKLLNPTTLAVKAGYTLPPRNFLSGKNPLTDLCGGAYFYLDNQNRVVVATTKRTIQVVADTGAAFHLVHSYDLTSVIPSSDCLIALNPDWNGNIWFVSSHGVVGDIDPGTGAVHALTLTGEIIDNSFATDETGGVFIASDHAMYRFDADASGGPVVTWRQTYDRGTRQKPGQLAQGTGTTPTLVGTDWVAITDNADPLMHVLVYQRGKDSGGALVCGVGVFQPGTSDTENSLVSVGNSLFVENNYGYKSPASTLFGQTTTPGISRVDFTAGGQCTVAWTANVSAPTSVAKASLGSGLLYAYTKPQNPLGIDAWYLTAIDLRTGAVVYSRLAGTGADYNNHYAAIYLRNGAAYVPTLTGMVRFRDTY